MYDHARAERALTDFFDTLRECSGFRFEYQIWFDYAGEEVRVELRGPDARLLGSPKTELREAVEQIAREAAGVRVAQVVAVERPEAEGGAGPAQASKSTLPIPPFSAAV